MKKIILLTIIFFIAVAESFAQRSCAFYRQLKTAEAIDASIQKQKEGFENCFAEWKRNIASGRFMIPDTIFIPVVVHVLWHIPQENIIDSQIISQLRILNEDFNGHNADAANTPAFFKSLRGKTHFFFQLAKQDPDGLATTGIDRHYTFREDGFSLDGSVNFTSLGGRDAWDPRYYINIWCCNMENASGTFAATYFPGGSLLREGIQCDYHYMGTGGITAPPYNLGRTITHEMGHYFNLDHIWGPSDITSVPFCGDDDHVEDTPPQSKANYYCPAFPKSSCGNYSDMFMNFMDYVDDPCMNMFSKGQAERMLAAYYIMTPYLKFSKALQQPKTFSTDAGVRLIIHPLKNGFTCNSKIIPEIVVRNYGTDTVKNIKIIYGFKGGSEQSMLFTLLALSPLTNDTVRLDALLTDNTGATDFFATTSLPNHKTDMQLSNDTAIVSFNINRGDGRALPFYENFSHSVFPPKGWSVLNPDRTFTWTPTNGSQLSGYAPSVMMDNIECPYKAEQDFLITPPLNFAAALHPQLIFDHAFQLYKNGKPLSDTLEIRVSANCGQSWQRVYYKGGKDLATVKPPQYGYFSPDKKSDWQTDTIHLENYAGSTSVMIAFVNVNGKENLLYIDNIGVQDANKEVAKKEIITRYKIGRINIQSEQ